MALTWLSLLLRLRESFLDRISACKGKLQLLLYYKECLALRKLRRRRHRVDANAMQALEGLGLQQGWKSGVEEEEDSGALPGADQVQSYCKVLYCSHNTCDIPSSR